MLLIDHRLIILIISLVLLGLYSLCYLILVVGKTIILSISQVDFAIWTRDVCKICFFITRQTSYILYFIDGTHFFFFKFVRKNYDYLLNFFLNKSESRDYFFFFGKHGDNRIYCCYSFMNAFHLFLVCRMIYIPNLLKLH